MKLGEMNWPDIQDLDRDRLVAVYPIASFEQHGPHLPLLTDTMETTEIVNRLDQRIPDQVVCLPTQWLGYSFHHMRFGGSLTASSETHIRVIVETVSGLIGAGFSKVLIVNGHGGNQPDLRVALQHLKEQHDRARVYGASWWEVAAAKLEQLKDAGAAGSGHAGEMETSLMLAIHPDLVKTDRFRDNSIRRESEYASSIVEFRRMDEWSEPGHWGDPTVATAQKGEQMLTAIVDSLEEIVDQILGGSL